MLDSSLIGIQEVENVKKIFLPLIDLPPTIAKDERFWAGLSIIHFWKYVQMRWHIHNNLTANNVLTHYLYFFNIRRSLTRNALARLWWIGKLTYDIKRDNKFELTSFVLSDTSYVIDLLERNFSNNPRIVKEVVEAIEQVRSEGFHLNRDQIRPLCIYVNMLGGVYILDAMNEGAIKTKVIEKAQKILKTQK